MTLKKKTLDGLVWSFMDSLAGQGITFVVGIVLSRLLTPREFGLVGMLTIFIAISTVFINSGFSQALIRKTNCTPEDYTTVFYFNLVVSHIAFLILFASAPIISAFYQEPELNPLVRALGLVLIVDAFSIIQSTTLTKRIDFRLQTRISILSSLCSGIIGISAAYMGFGAWSLVLKTVSARMINSALLWAWNRWRPVGTFCMKSFNEMFSFGSKLLITGLIDTFYRNIYYFVIGKYFSAAELGFYARADMFKNLPSQNINGIISRVSYPVLAALQDNPEQLKAGYKRLIASTMIITFILMMGMAAVAEPLVITLVGEQWRPCIIYLQMLCFAGMLYPLHALNLNMLNVKGRSDLFLKLEIIKKVLAVPTIIIGVIYGIKIMIIGMMVNSLVAYYLNSYWSGKLIGYPMLEQISDIMPSFGIAFVIGVVVYFSGQFLPYGYFPKLCLQILIGAGMTLLIFELCRIQDYLYLKDILRTKVYNLGGGQDG